MKRLFACLLMAVSSFTFAASYNFDKVHTQIFFTANHVGFSNSTGAFLDFDGNFNFDPESIEDAFVEVVIQTNSIDLNDKKWNDHMQGAKWFDAVQFPTMRFKSTKVTKTGEKTMDVVGDFTLKGVTKPVTLKVTFNKMGEFFGKEKVGFSATTTINRLDFGMSANKQFIGTDIPIRIEVEGEKGA